MSKLFSTRIRVYVVFMSKSPPFRTRPLRKDYRRRTTGDKLNEKLEWSIRESTSFQGYSDSGNKWKGGIIELKVAEHSFGSL